MIDFEAMVCDEDGCSAVWGMIPEVVDGLRESEKVFFCPNGHERYFPGGEPTKMENLERSLKNSRVYGRDLSQRLKDEKASHNARKGAMTRLKNKLKLEAQDGGQ